MSTISSIHSVVPFIVGKTTALPLNRLCKVGYKTTKKQKAKFASIAVSIPPLTPEVILEENTIDRLIPHIASYLEGVQDSVVRSLYESSGGKLQSVSDADISIEQCIAYLESESSGGRMTKEVIERWFTEVLEDNLTVVIAEKLGTQDVEDVKVKQMIAGYKGMFSALSGGATVYSLDKVENLLRAIAYSGESDDEEKEGSITQKLTKKLELMKTPKEKTFTMVDL